MATILHESDSVELVSPVAPDRIWFADVYGNPHLTPGDRGAVVDVHADGTAAVEFMRGECTIALVDVRPDEVRVLVHHAATTTASASID